MKRGVFFYRKLTLIHIPNPNAINFVHVNGRSFYNRLAHGGGGGRGIIIINNALIKVTLSCQRHCRGTVGDVLHLSQGDVLHHVKKGGGIVQGEKMSGEYVRGNISGGNVRIDTSYYWLWDP